MKYLSIIAVLLVSIVSKGQHRIPVFNNSEDSTTYFQIQEIFGKSVQPVQQYSLPKNAFDSLIAARDSLFTVQQNILTRSLVRWKYVYTPNTDYTSFNDLLQGRINPSNVTRLSISSYKGKRLSRKVKECSNLEELELVNTSCERIQNLNKLKRLKAIYIYNNSTSKPLKLGHNKRIRILKIEGNDPEKLPINFKNFKALDSLDLMRNSLREFPVIHQNKNLKVLSLSENLLTLENLAIKPNKYLERLYLRNNKIVTVPATLSSLMALKEITFSGNEIADVEPGFEKLTKLENVSFYKNKLTVIPTPVFKLSNLKEIDLYFNAISHIDTAIANLKNLEILYLSHNRISSLPENIGKLSQLKELYAHHNLLTSLPSDIERLNNLSVLRINNNIFTTLPSLLWQLDQLEVLDVGYNKLTSLPLEVLDLKNLRFLAITENPWDDRDGIVSLSQALRKQGVNVHNNSLRDVVENR